MITDKLIIKESGQYDHELITRLRLENMNIKMITNLNKCSCLIELSLKNNNIENINGLNSLLTLNRLDLSFNKIRKIENLNNLTLLQYLDLRHNNISSINDINELRPCLELNCLYLQGNDGEDSNPACKHPSYITIILKSLPQLKILDGGHLQILDAFQSLDEHMNKLQPDENSCKTPPSEPWFDTTELLNSYPSLNSIKNNNEDLLINESNLFKDIIQANQMIEDMIKEDSSRLLRKSQSVIAKTTTI